MTAYGGFIVVMSLAAVMLRPSLAAAQLSNGDVSSIPSIRIGQKVSVTTSDGRKVKGQVLSLSAATVEIGAGREPATSLAIADVRRIQAADSVKNGVIKGAISLGLAGFLAGSIADAGNAAGQAFGGFFTLLLGAEPEPIKHTRHHLTGTVAGVAAGALLGYALDADREKTIFERETVGLSVELRPLVSAEGKGVGVRVRW